MNKILLFGCNGQVGYELQRSLAPLGELIALDYPEIDFAKPLSVRSKIREVQPLAVVNAAAYTDVDKAENEEELAHVINGITPGAMAMETQDLGAWLVHYSTDYVYDGTQSEPYTEDVAKIPLNAYGWSKLAGDQSIEDHSYQHLIFRLCSVYGTRGRNFFRTIRRLAKKESALRVVADQTMCPTWSRMVAETTALVLSQVLVDPEYKRRSGTYNLCSSGQATWHEFAQAIVETIPPDERKCQEVQSITSADYPFPTKRPPYSVMSCKKLERAFGLRLPHWKDSLKLVVEDMKDTLA